MAVEELSFDQLRALSAGKDFAFRTTADIEPLREIIGQDRAVRAIEFGLGIRTVGYNIFVAGWPGTGRRHVITRFLQEKKAGRPCPPDWCYVNNFEQPDRPVALRLDAGMGPALEHDMDKFIQVLLHDLPKEFESEQHVARRNDITNEFRAQRETIQENFNEEVRKLGLSVQQTPIGLGIVPLNDNGEQMKREEFEALPEEKQDEIHARQEGVQERLEAIMRQLRQLDAAMRDKLRELDQSLTRKIVEEHVHGFCEKYQRFDKVCTFLRSVVDDIVKNAEHFKTDGQEEAPDSDAAKARAALMMARKEFALDRYKVNVFVTNDPENGPPVIYEANPTHPNLFGRIERRYTMGALVTDFTMLKAGALHQANGGYLVVDAVDVLLRPASWDALKRCIESRQIEMEDIGQALGYAYTETLRPEPIPMDAKIIVVGNPMIYNLLYGLDEDFRNLFKVKAELGTDMDRTADSLENLARLIARQCREHDLRPFDAAAVAAVANYASRLIEDRDKISTQFTFVTDVLTEADHWAQEAKSKTVTAKHVDKAIAEKVYRSNLVEEKMQEMIRRGTLMISTTGKRVGQANGLVINQLGDYYFGLPSRVTANVHIGSAGVVHIERKADLSGPIHTKGVEILAGLLGERFCQERPLTLSATLTFEQTYGGVEGDSASGAEYFALLAALADVPINQSIAITGSINQKGDYQAIGGATRKVEGFFDVCRMTRLTGRQGVILPRTNARNLVLRDDVVEAVRKGKFHVWVIDSVDDGIELLTGLPAGERQKDGSWTPGSIAAKVDARLRTYAEKAKSFIASATGNGNGTKSVKAKRDQPKESPPAKRRRK